MNSKKLLLAILSVAMLTSIFVVVMPDRGIAAEDTEAPQLAPLNPDFINYWKNPPEKFYGYIPPPMNLSHVRATAIKAVFPSRFDWRDYGMVTPVKNQDPCGTCWDFGTTSVLESAVLIGEGVEYDFSEQSVALCVDRSWVYLYDGIDPYGNPKDDPCQGGGGSWTASSVFIKKGSVLESCNHYDCSALNCDGTCICDDCPSIKKVDGYRLVTNYGSQIDAIKNAVYNHGPVTIVYCHDSRYEYWNLWGCIYDYYPCNVPVNHLISIIGWDDDVPHPNFLHGGTGAWIVKNSWGTEDWWASDLGISNGFFYFAYNSSSATDIAYLEYKDHDPNEELLYWDEAGHVDNVGYGDNDAWMASVFTADQASNLNHVDFWTTSPNAQYEIYVWNDFFGTELAHQTGNCQEYGYYSIPLDTSISFDAGERFTVGVKMITPGFNSPLAVEKYLKYPTGVVNCNPPIQSGVSFLRNGDSDSWKDLADYGWNGCLRARINVSFVPNIWAAPTSFYVTLPPDETWNGKLEIGNNGKATLTYSMTDIETTGAPCFKWVAQDPEPLPSGETGILEAEVYHSDGLADMDYVKFWVTQDSSDWGYMYDDGSYGDKTPGDGIYTATVYGTTFYGEELAMLLEAKDLAGNYGHTSFEFHVAIPEGAAAEGKLFLGTKSITTGIRNIAGMSKGGNNKESSAPTVPEIPLSDILKQFQTKDCPWLDENPKSGDVEHSPPTSAGCDEITISIDTTGLTQGKYSAEIYITNNDPDENPTIVPVQLMVTLSSCEGDFDGDGDIDGSDLATFADAYATGDDLADLNNDGNVDAKDLAIFAANFGRMDYQ